MFNIFKKKEKPQSKLASFSAKGLDLNEAELKKVIGGGGGPTDTTGSTADATGTGTGTKHITNLSWGN